MSEPIIMENESYERVEYCPRWNWANGSVSYGPIFGDLVVVQAFLDAPPHGVAAGELVRRTITTTPWEPVPDAPAQQALTGQPQHDFTLPGFPADVVRDSGEHDGLRYMVIGDDGETVVILGHPKQEQLDAFQRWFAKEQDFDLDDSFVSAPFETYCRQLHRCPTHERKNADCTWCMFISDGEPWLDWSVQKNDGRLVNAGKDGYFPVVVWEVGA
jgi:hypothetical protein